MNAALITLQTSNPEGVSFFINQKWTDARGIELHYAIQYYIKNTYLQVHGFELSWPVEASGAIVFQNFASVHLCTGHTLWYVLPCPLFLILSW